MKRIGLDKKGNINKRKYLTRLYYTLYMRIITKQEFETLLKLIEEN